MTDREAFEAWAKEKGTPFHSVDRNPEYSVVAWMAWQAATAAERERCAKVCDAISENKWALYKGRPPYTGREAGRASDFVQGQSDGAEQCADAIRKGE